MLRIIIIIIRVNLATITITITHTPKRWFTIYFGMLLCVYDDYNFFFSRMHECMRSREKYTKTSIVKKKKKIYSHKVLNKSFF